MKRFVSMLLTLAVIALATHLVLGKSKADAAFEKLKSLAGEWQNSSSDAKSVKVSYQVVSGGSALMESLTPADEPPMITMYHLDGDRLLMTHYCSVGNQPRMKAQLPAGEIKKLNFTMVDATNMAKSSDMHMHSLEFTFQDDDHITQVWSLRQEGKDTPMTFNLERKK